MDDTKHNHNGRLAYIDIAKGILIILVVIGHILKGSVFVTKSMIRIINAFHMPAFFIISGFLTNEAKLREQKFSDYVKKRAIRLLVPYVVFEVLGGIWQMLVMGSDAVNLTGIIYRILTVHCHVGADWFLIALFVSEVFLYWTVKCDNRIWYYILITAAFLTAFYLPEYNWLMANLRRVAASFAFILTGLCCKRFFAHRSLLLFMLCAAGLVLGAYINTGTASIALRLFQNPILFVCCGIWGTYAVFYVSQLISKHKHAARFLEQCGRASLIIMGTHQNVLVPFNVFLGNWMSFSVKFTILALTAVIEVPAICFCKKFLPSWVGEKKQNSLPH